MHVGVVQRMSTELISLHEGDEGGVELEIVGLYRKASNRRSNARCL